MWGMCSPRHARLLAVVAAAIVFIHAGCGVLPPQDECKRSQCEGNVAVTCSFSCNTDHATEHRESCGAKQCNVRDITGTCEYDDGSHAQRTESIAACD